MKALKLMLVLALILLNPTVSSAVEFKVTAGAEGTLQYSEQWSSDLDLQGTLKLKWHDLNLALGADRLIWGEGHTGTLGLSSTSPVLPQFYYDYQWSWKWLEVDYTRFMGMMERDENRWLFGHRLTGKFGPVLEVGAWELMVCSNQIYPLFYIPVPLFPLYGTQHLAYKTSNGIYDFNSNAMIGLDFRYHMPRQWDLYGELLVDDFPGGFDRVNPKKAAGLLGVEWQGWQENLTLWAEYVRVNNFVYTHRNSRNRYMYENQPFGHWLGMDGDLLAVGLEQQIAKKDHISWQIHLIRKGEGDFTDNWSINYGDELEFLSGIVTSKGQLSANFVHTFAQNFTMDTTAILGVAQNAEHQVGSTETYLNFMIKLIYNFDFVID